MTLSKEEKNAIAALKRLAKRWPRTLCLSHSAGAGSALAVKRVDDSKDLCELEAIEIIFGFNADSEA